jgi:hypothetical protein
VSRVELADGNWAELRDPKRVTERARRRYISRMSEFNKSRAGADVGQYGADQQDLFDDAIDLLIVALVESWSLEQPVTVDALSDLRTDVFDPLKKACLALAGDVLPDYSPSPDPPAAGASSSDSPPDSPAPPTVA